jgi:ribosome maturation factor RimP
MRSHVLKGFRRDIEACSRERFRTATVRERPLFYVYNGSVELQQWAKAHFFIGRMKDSVLARVVEIVERVGAAEGLEIVDVELKGGGASRLLRIYIDKPEGVTHGDCEKVSSEVGSVLDAEDVIPGSSYTLEVSSPGVERKLSRPRDFERFVGQKVKVALKDPIENQKRWEGALLSFAAGVITLRTGSGKDISFGLDQVSQANLKFEW